MPLGIFGGFGQRRFQQQLLVVALTHVFQRHLQHIAQGLTAAGLRNGSGKEFIGRCVNVIDFDSWKSLLEHRKNFLGVDLGQGRVEI